MPACSSPEIDSVGMADDDSAATRLLIVRHGAGRGPRQRFRTLRPAYCQQMLDDIAGRWPLLGRRFRQWETGQPLPSLDDVAAVLFLLQDPLAERFPDCFAEAAELASAARDKGIRVINGPECLSNTIKSRQAKLWRRAGFSTPPCFSFGSCTELECLAASIDGPMILKADWEHAQRQMLLVADRSELKRLPAHRIPLPGSLSPLVDVRASYRAVDPDSLFAKYYHKKRAMVFGRHVQSNHVFFSQSPIVGCVSSTFGHYRSVNPIRRLVGRVRCAEHVKADLQYHFSVCEHAEELASAARALGLEFCAIDYSVHADGQLELWEANPHFSLHLWPVEVLAAQRRLAERTPQIHATAAKFFSELVGVKA